MKKNYIIHLLILTVLISGCVQKKSPDSKNNAADSIESRQDDSDLLALRVGLMPAVDTAPVFLAKEKGYYRELGLDLSISLFTNAQNRQSALQSGEIDGAMTDLVAVAVNISGGFDFKATMLTDGMFPLLAVPGAVDKTNIKVGMMEISVSNFLVDQWIGSDFNIEKIYINSIPARLEAVSSKQLDMGLFPEPIASVGALNGLEKLIYEPVDGFSPDVMVFTSDALMNKSEAVRIFHEGYNRAVEDIRTSESEARDILIKSIPNLKPGLRDAMTLPEYHMARLPDEAYLNKIIDWTKGIVDMELNVTPASMVDRSFVKQ